MKLVNRTKLGSFFLTRENQSLTIRRYAVLENGKRTSIRIPRKVFRNCSSKESFYLLIDKLNKKRTSKAYSIQKNSIISADLLSEFQAQLLLEIPNEKDSRNHFRNVNRYFLDFFIQQLKLSDPNDWKLNENKWGAALLSEPNSYRLFEDGKIRSIKTIKGIVQIANRLMVFLHQRRPREFPAICFTPISKARLKLHHAKINLEKEKVGSFINSEDWQKIESRLPDDIKGFIKLGYYYGLRRSETLGVSLSELGKSFLSLKKQFGGNGEYIPLKNRNRRKIPHWFIEPKQTYGLIKEIEGNRVHPDTLSGKFQKLMDELSLPYKLHDLRRTFITRALDLNNGNALPVMLAVGHSNSDTTMKYLRDPRNMEFELFTP